jgi:methylglyoxal synthase
MQKNFFGVWFYSLRLLKVLTGIIRYSLLRFGAFVNRGLLAAAGPQMQFLEQNGRRDPYRLSGRRPDGLRSVGGHRQARSGDDEFSPLSSRSLPPTIALIAHDANKPAILEFARRHRDRLRSYRLIATGTTGRLIHETTGLTIERKLSGPMGGDAQIAAEVTAGHIKAVIFLIDPLSAKSHEPDIQSLLRLCEVHNVPLATNLATSEIILMALSQALLVAA